MNDTDQRILLSVHEHVIANTEDIAEIKVDLREHIRRTAVLESKVSWMERLVWLGTGGAGVVYFFLKLTKVL